MQMTCMSLKCQDQCVHILVEIRQYRVWVELAVCLLDKNGIAAGVA
jgi:hypothetical protein